ncbi:hypothetical protein BC827DRAFT_1155828 [Russula dissimulans]|nr:hypothetical protein BC827DRAFT_1155828 [Russula dissimulans]
MTHICGLLFFGHASGSSTNVSDRVQLSQMVNINGSSPLPPTRLRSASAGSEQRLRQDRRPTHIQFFNSTTPGVLASMGFFKAVDAGSHLLPTNLLSGVSTSHGPGLLLRLRCDPPPADSAPPTLPPLRLPPLPGRADDADADVACVAGGRDRDWPRARKESPGRAPRAPCVDVEMSHACF